MQQRAAELRRRETRTERRLWQALRNHRLDDVKFRRQHVLGRFVVDFFAPGHRLVVEIDGSAHDGRAEFDHARERALLAMGYRIVRFSTDEIALRLPRVLATIRTHVQGSLSSPLPRGERGRG